MVQKYILPENVSKKSKETVSNDTLNFILNFSKSIESKKLKKKTIILHTKKYRRFGITFD
jgi:hypothetical protein